MTDVATTGIDTSEMGIIHKTLNREFGRLPDLFRTASGNPARAKIVADHALEMLGFLHNHHHGEDELMYPLLYQRVSLEKELIDRMETQHAAIAAAVDKLTTDLPAWSASADAAAGERLAAEVEEALPLLAQHLEEEEVEMLPIASKHLTQAEWNALGKHGMASIAPKRRMVVLGYILASTQGAETAKFLKILPPPVRLLWKLVGRRQYLKALAQLTG